MNWFSAFFSAILIPAFLGFTTGCSGNFSCNGKQLGENCTFNGSAGFCEGPEGYCLLACSGPMGSCTGAGSGAACYWLTGNDFVCRGSGDPRSPGDVCSGKITDCGDRNWCLTAGDGGSYCEIPCRNDEDCTGQSGTVCRNISDGGGLQICVPLTP